ncbi:MAG: hypothetical protein HY518_03320 [Candidatus Aenigmarchaeota archaeon]|nr:hypothetical protein [Candidatus Aenigmarchaeota archaeon]
MRIYLTELDRQYWTADDLMDLDTAKSYGRLSVIGERVISRMAGPVGMVCGPISHGGLYTERDPEFWENMDRLLSRIRLLQEEGKSVFNQLPFEGPMSRLMASGNGNPNSLLNGVYLPLFEKGLIEELYHSPGWHKSYGSIWEHTQGKRFVWMSNHYLLD